MAKYLNKTGLQYFYTKIKAILATKTELNNWNPPMAQFPVGSIYMSTSSTNPSSYFGGTWELWGSGKTPVGVDTSDSDFNTVEKTGGEKEHELLNPSEIPAHTHTYSYLVTQSDAEGSSSNKYRYSSRATTNTGSAPFDGGYAHNNLQPYMVCYIWKKTAA